jgi:hypothetical protein
MLTRAGAKRKMAADADPDPGFEVNENLVRGGSLNQRRQFAWLERSKLWDSLQPANDWKARKVLGRGGTGLCGLFDYLGSNNQIPPQVVVKQSMGWDAQELHAESKLLTLAASTGTDHIVKIYKGYHRGGGTGVSDEIDPIPFRDGDDSYQSDDEVARIFMEYLPGGDLYHSLLSPLINMSGPVVVPEEHLWRMLGCLAKSALVLGASIQLSIPYCYLHDSYIHQVTSIQDANGNA